MSYHMKVDHYLHNGIVLNLTSVHLSKVIGSQTVSCQSADEERRAPNQNNVHIFLCIIHVGKRPFVLVVFIAMREYNV